MEESCRGPQLVRGIWADRQGLRGGGSWSVHGRHRIALVELTCPWDTDTKRAEEHKTARYEDLKITLSNEGWDCNLYLIEVGAQGHIIKLVKDHLRSLFRAWVPAGHRSGIGQMMKVVSRIFLVCSFTIF
jgi:hypothetical protein